MRLLWEDRAWEDYLRWQEVVPRALKRVNALLKAIVRTPFEGIGKPEPLSGNLSGYWSRRVDGGNRLVYRVEAETVYLIACRGHYDKS